VLPIDHGRSVGADAGPGALLVEGDATFAENRRDTSIGTVNSSG
jgi:hypothetical protein